ncbi:MAG: hypothetical protein ACOZIN_11855 [Myxococcota bacterium]
MTIKILPLPLLLLAACGEVEPCHCDAPSSYGPIPVACGQSVCLDKVGWHCGASQRLSADLAVCQAQAGCPKTTCATAGAQCGTLPDGCGGTLDCGGCATGKCVANACVPSCAKVSCGAGQRCEEATGACVANACSAAGAVCGSLGGVLCGTCPTSSTCSQTQKACVEKLATLPFADFVGSSTLAGERLFAAGPPTTGSSNSNVVELTLSTGQVRTLATQLESCSPLSANGTHLFWATTSGLSRVALGGTTIEPVSGLFSTCTSLLASSQQVFCGLGGNAKYGVDAFGVQSVPVSGGSAQQVVSFLNYPSLSLVGTFLFHLGTSDNYYSYAHLGVTDLSDGFQQTLVSGGILDSHFLLTDAQAYYFVREDGAQQTLVRTAFDAAQGTDLFTGEGLRYQCSVATGTEVWTFADVGGNQGLFRVPVSGGTPERVLSAADVGGDLYEVTSLHRRGNEWLVVSGTEVYRVFRPTAL